MLNFYGAIIGLVSRRKCCVQNLILVAGLHNVPTEHTVVAGFSPPLFSFCNVVASVSNIVMNILDMSHWPLATVLCGDQQVFN